jgi:hypothetical protein
MTKERVSKKVEVTKYNIRYKPCGHTRAIKVSETELIILATRNKGSLVLDSFECPTCIDRQLDTINGEDIIALSNEQIEKHFSDIPTHDELLQDEAIKIAEKMLSGN